MTCRDMMTKDPTCCVPGDTVARVAKLMKTQDVGSLPICESRTSRRLMGIVTDRDLALHIVGEGRDPNHTSVQDVMTRDPITCAAEEDVQSAMNSMQQHQIRRVPVVDAGGQLVGIISQADIATRAKQPEKTAETVGEISRPAAHAA